MFKGKFRCFDIQLQQRKTWTKLCSHTWKLGIKSENIGTTWNMNEELDKLEREREAKMDSERYKQINQWNINGRERDSKPVTTETLIHNRIISL